MDITVVIPTSPIPSHPSTRILEQTIASAQKHLPSAPIVVTFDGVPLDQVHLSTAYSKYVWEATKLSTITRFLTFDKHVHQSGMMLAVLPTITTKLLLYLEHDWEIGAPVDWPGIKQVILEGHANYVKFHAGNRIHPLHEHMMEKRRIVGDVPVIHTLQYSANPHVALVEWYRSLVPFFEGKTDFIENLLHGPIAIAPWNAYKLAIYNPIDGDMKRSFHLDGKGTR